MKSLQPWFREIVAQTPPEISQEVELTMGLSDRLANLMDEKGISKVQLVTALGKWPSEVTRRLSGQHNFTLKTIAMLSSYFSKPIISIVR